MLNLTRRSLLLGLGGAAALAITPSIANSAGFKVRSAVFEIRPPKRHLKHYFAFDTGIYHGLKMHNMNRWKRGLSLLLHLVCCGSLFTFYTSRKASFCSI
ncbi:hypothetical protein QA332_09040 [Glaesserella parasuis]|nr:hypothetical protein [Glaesserella parasuis]MDG6793914.1 hypothetical protein [Glaesserella parasuis]MDG6854726.1 hypothetical protein [Glaesserella parasuis]MDO9959086.1 hypothetical protein [Glaesserella parasuis]MDP0052472.1 hypothetical protein [Glaesserella parasuis]